MTTARLIIKSHVNDGKYLIDINPELAYIHFFIAAKVAESVTDLSEKISDATLDIYHAQALHSEDGVRRAGLIARSFCLWDIANRRIQQEQK